MGAGSLYKKQPRPALTCKPAEEEEAGLDWIGLRMLDISNAETPSLDPEVFMWMDFALNVNVYHLQLGVADGTFVGMSAALQRWATEPSSWIKKKI